MAEQMSHHKRKIPAYIVAVLYIAILFYLAFPKAGIKWHGIPLTLQDVLLLVLLLFCLTKLAYWGKILRQNRTLILLLLIFASYAALKLGYAYWHSGWLDPGVIVPLLIYPTILLVLLLFDQLYEISWDRILLLPVAAFFILAIYAFIQFFGGVENTMLPGLTYNWTDAHTPGVFFDKNNFYGPYTKIFSTYQNGNILGVNLLLMFPLVFEWLYERRKSLGYVAMVLFITVALFTASRAVWAGVLGYILLRFFICRPGWKKVEVVLPGAFMSALILLIEPLRYRLNMFLGKETIPKIVEIPGMAAIAERARGEAWAWLTPKGAQIAQIENLSDRKDTLLRLWEATFGALNWGAILLGPYGILPRNSFAITGEMVYVAIFGYLGLAGLILWALPILYSLYNFLKRRDDFVIRGVLLGLICYFTVAIVEGAYWLSPTAFNLWLIIAIGWLRVNYLNKAVIFSASGGEI